MQALEPPASTVNESHCASVSLFINRSPSHVLPHFHLQLSKGLNEIVLQCWAQGWVWRESSTYMSFGHRQLVRCRWLGSLFPHWLSHEDTRVGIYVYCWEHQQVISKAPELRTFSANDS